MLDSATEQTRPDHAEQVEYVLGSDQRELDRLDVQARYYQPATEDALRRAGLRPGMRVIDIGCGTGAVSLVAARIVGPSGEVLGVDAADEPLAVARACARDAGLEQVRFERADLASWTPPAAYDALTGRLIAMYLPDARSTIARLAASLRPGGIVVLQEFAISLSVQTPTTPLFAQSLRRVLDAFAAVGVPTDLGLGLEDLLREARVEPQMVLAATRVEQGREPVIYTILAEVLRTLSGVLIGNGLVSERELDIDTLETRLRMYAAAAGSRAMGPPLCSAWGRTPSRSAPHPAHH